MPVSRKFASALTEDVHQRNSSGARLLQQYERDSEVASVVSSCLFLALSEELSKQCVPAATSTPTKVPDSGKSQSAALQSLPTL